MTKVHENGRLEVEGRQNDTVIELTAKTRGDGVVISEKVHEKAAPVAKAKKQKGSSKPKEPEAHPGEVEVPRAEPAVADAPQTKTRKVRKPAGGATLAQLKESYVLSLEEDGKSGGTIASYAAEVDLALGILGADTKVADLTVKQVQRYFDHERVVQLRNGKPKSQLSIDKTRRVFRQALEFAAENNWIEQAPLPESKSKGQAK